MSDSLLATLLAIGAALCIAPRIGGPVRSALSCSASLPARSSGSRQS
ncbi:hypothetical protein [Rhodococcus triatomae]